MKKTFTLIFVAIVVTAVRAGNPSQTATIISESSVDCGTKAHGHHQTEKEDLLCQEYVVRTATTEYHIRQPKQKDQGLLPLNSNIEFNMNKETMKFKLNGKQYQYLVVSEAAITPQK